MPQKLQSAGNNYFEIISLICKTFSCIHLHLDLKIIFENPKYEEDRNNIIYTVFLTAYCNFFGASVIRQVIIGLLVKSGFKTFV